MSKALDETALLATIKTLIDDYGRNVTFYQADHSTAYAAVKMTPPRRVIGQPDDNIPTETKIGVISASGLAWTPFEGQRVVDESVSYYVTIVQPISSGDTTQAYKITFQR